MSTCIDSADASGQKEARCLDTASLTFQLLLLSSAHLVSCCLILQHERLQIHFSQSPSEFSATHVQKLKEQLKGLDEELHKTPATLEELKQVLNVINTIRSTSMNMELRYVDLEERFRQVEHVRRCDSRNHVVYLLRIKNAGIKAYTCLPACLCRKESQQE